VDDTHGRRLAVSWPIVAVGGAAVVVGVHVVEGVLDVDVGLTVLAAAHDDVGLVDDRQIDVGAVVGVLRGSVVGRVLHLQQRGLTVIVGILLLSVAGHSVIGRIIIPTEHELRAHLGLTVLQTKIVHEGVIEPRHIDPSAIVDVALCVRLEDALDVRLSLMRIISHFTFPSRTLLNRLVAALGWPLLCQRHQRCREQRQWLSPWLLRWRCHPRDQPPRAAAVTRRWRSRSRPHCPAPRHSGAWRWRCQRRPLDRHPLRRGRRRRRRKRCRPRCRHTGRRLWSAKPADPAQ